MTRLRAKRLRKGYLKYGLLGFGTAVLTAGVAISLTLLLAAQRPIEADLILGGSIRREMFVAEQLGEGLISNRPILISSGSQDPCIRLLFEQSGVALDSVWLEKCAQSTFGNFRYSLPLLKRWRTRHVRLITSGSHTLRAVWMARIMFGSHGIWVTPDIVSETGIPGNQESPLKTGLDLTRSVLWAVVSHVYSPGCDAVLPLISVDMRQWRERGFKCEHQAGIEGS